MAKHGRLIDADALMEAINTWPKVGVDEHGRIVPWNEGYEPYIHLRDAVIAITGMPTIEQEPCNDAIKAIADHSVTGNDGLDYVETLVALNALKMQKSERKKGKWIHLGGDEWCCDKCGNVITTEGSWEHPHKIGMYHCNICGADMRGDQDESTD